LFLTAKSKDEDKITGFNVGADDYLSKPFNIDELILRVRAILRRTKTQQRQKSQEVGETTTMYSDATPQIRSNGGPAKNDRDESSHCLSVGEYVLDTRSYELQSPHHGKMRLTPVQFDLLYHLMSHPGEIFSPARLLDEVWDYPSDAGSPDLVRVHIKNLRERIELDPRIPTFIRTVPGYGYTINSESE
jgi:two-component system alkaline phosphatase synthesis response regulator PhoP/two-component system response regulator RpaA